MWCKCVFTPWAFSYRAPPTLLLQAGEFAPKVTALGWPEQNCLAFLSSLLQDRDGSSLAVWGGQSRYKGFAAPASLARTQCYFSAGAGRAHAAFGRMLSFCFLWKSQHARPEVRKNEFSKRTKSREKSMQSFGLYLVLKTGMVFAKIWG